jgi:hypothetical protein
LQHSRFRDYDLTALMNLLLARWGMSEFHRITDLAAKFAIDPTYRCRWHCKQGHIVFVFTPKRGVNPNQYQNRGPDSLLELTDEIQIVIEPPDQQPGLISARFSVRECVEFLEGKWPNSESFDRIAALVRERKAYPPPEPGVPGGGGKSMTAQGQTKKDGSHSQDRHK